MGTSRLALYNSALLIMGERAIASLTENVKARRSLDSAWNDNAVKYCLEQGQWQFAMRTERIDYDPDVDVEFGYQFAFNKPDDWVLTSAFCSDENFRSPLSLYHDETDYWYSDTNPIYVRYVSNDATYGGDLSRWPSTFCDYVATYLASKTALDITGSRDIVAEIMRPRMGLLDRALLKAKNRAAMTQGAQRPAPGSWVMARAGNHGRGPFGDGGTSGSLIG
jgi:hypothetical protein